MKRVFALLLTICICFSSISLCFAEGWKGLLGDTFANIESAFTTDKENGKESEDKNKSNPLDDMGTIVAGLFKAETGIPKEIHYGDFELFKQDIDTVEAYFEAYADFMNSYDANDLSMFSEYTSMMAKYVEAMEVLESLDITKMSKQEEKYYLDTLIDINKILYDLL